MGNYRVLAGVDSTNGIPTLLGLARAMEESSARKLLQDNDIDIGIRHHCEFDLIVDAFSRSVSAESLKKFCPDCSHFLLVFSAMHRSLCRNVDKTADTCLAKGL